MLGSTFSSPVDETVTNWLLGSTFSSPVDETGTNCFWWLFFCLSNFCITFWFTPFTIFCATPTRLTLDSGLIVGNSAVGNSVSLFCINATCCDCVSRSESLVFSSLDWLSFLNL